MAYLTSRAVTVGIEILFNSLWQFLSKNDESLIIYCLEKLRKPIGFILFVKVYNLITGHNTIIIKTRII